MFSHRKRTKRSVRTLCLVGIVVFVFVLMMAYGSLSWPGARAGDNAIEGETSDMTSDSAADATDSTTFGGGAAQDGVFGPEASESTSARSASHGTRSWTSDNALEVEATRLLQDYEASSDCVLAQVGFLDLMGQVWSCTVQGDRWVDVCIVRATTDGGSQVSVQRMEAGAWEEELGGQDDAQG